MTFRADFRRISSRSALIAAIGTDEATFDAVLAFEPPPRRDPQPVDQATVQVLEMPLFFRHDIPKRNRARGYRTVWEPALAKSEYKALARRLETFFRLVLPDFPHDAVYGYRSGRNIRENAAVHAGNTLLLSIDLEDFFPSISLERVAQLFEATGIDSAIADLLARFVTIGGSLPLGLPTSPVISNAVALPLDRSCQALADISGISYTRYADDLSFSGNISLPDIDALRSIVESHGFSLAEEKTRRSKLGQAHYVTGLSVSDALQPHVPRKKKRRLRQELYYASKFGLGDHLRHLGVTDARLVQQEVNRLDGMVRFVAHHEQAKATALKAQLKSVLDAEGLKPSFAPRGQHRAPFYMFIDEAEFERDGTPVLALAVAVSQHGPHLAREGAEVLWAAKEDLYAAGDAAALVKRGLHYADATEDLKIEYVKRLSTLRFEGYVAFADYAGSRDYEKTYLRLLGALITRRLMAAESQFALIYCESNNKVSAAKIETLIQKTQLDLEERNDRRPVNVFIEMVAKPHLGISVPDFLLGVLGKYLRSKQAPAGKPETRDRLMFERLRDKYRLILDVPNWIEYSRRRPITPWDDEPKARPSKGGADLGPPNG